MKLISMKLADIKKLQQKKYREEFGYFLVEGEHLVLELQNAAKKNSELTKSVLYVTPAYENWATDFHKILLTEKQMATISATKTPPGIIALTPLIAAAKSTSEYQRTIYLHEVQDPGNLGTILRTLAWFGNFRLLLSPNSVDLFSPKVVRASMGAIFHVPFELDIPLETLSRRFKNIACLDMQGKDLRDASFKTMDCYLFGNEARGVPRDSLDTLNAQAFTIRGQGAIESLNLATAVNICVYEIMR